MRRVLVRIGWALVIVWGVIATIITLRTVDLCAILFVSRPVGEARRLP